MRVVVGMSGGVDSAVAALLLTRAGHDVAGLYMKNWEDDDSDAYCSSAADYQSARAACETLEIPLFSTNLSGAYKERVFHRFLAGYARGETPNPDVLCNREIKFEAFWDEARALGAERIATGHYAQLTQTPAGALLTRGRDLQKDQSYFLSLVTHRQLQRAVFPVGHLTKPEVRALAHAAALPNHDRPDSTGICFIGERAFRPFLKRYLASAAGPIRTVDGRLLGTHEGLMYYTLGQRQGLGIGGAGGPWYVVDKVAAHDLLVVAGSQDPALYHLGLLARDLEWRPHAPALPWRGRAQIRHRQPDQGCLVETAGALVRVTFDHPQRAVTPGQAIAFYEEGVCLGGGTIAALLERPTYPWLDLGEHVPSEPGVSL